MQEEQQEEEQDPLFYDLPLPRLLGCQSYCSRLQEEDLGVIGPYLKTKKGVFSDRVALLRTNWAARGRELDYIKHST